MMEFVRRKPSLQMVSARPQGRPGDAWRWRSTNLFVPDADFGWMSPPRREDGSASEPAGVRQGPDA
jgi:hypothetical protein